MSSVDPPPPPPAPPPPPPPYGAQAAPGYGYAYPVPPKNEGNAVAALVCSIAAWVTCPVVLAVVALVLVPSSKRKIAESNGALTGESLLTATKIIAWLNIGFYGLAFLAIIAVGVLGVIFGGATDSNFNSDFQRVVVLVSP